MTTFSELGLRPELLEAVNKLGFTSPTPIQEQTIPLLTENITDLVALAQTGTGKTAAFGLPLLNILDEERKTPQALILCPTRELCMQISKDLESYAVNLPKVKLVAVYGGAAISAQIMAIKRGVQIVVATPGRLKDLIERKAVRLDEVETVILDEADEMLNMGFREDIDFILSTTPEEKQTWLFSATMPPEVASISKNYMVSPVEIAVGKKNSGATNISHMYYMVNAGNRYNALKRIADYHPDIYGIIFCRTKVETQDIAEKLIKDGYSADSLHGDLSQAQRDAVMRKFRNKSLQMLVATDVAARGIDVDDITHVIHYNIPDDTESYTHRSGRTARAGKSGISLAIITPRDLNKIRQVEHKIGTTFAHKPVPTGIEVCEQQLLHLAQKTHDVAVNPDIEQYLPAIIESFADKSKDEVIKSFLSLEFNRFLDYYKNAQDLNENKGASRERGRPDGVPMTRYFVSVGELDGVDKSGMVRLICDSTGIPNAKIGKIELRRSFSFFEVPVQFENIVETRFEEVLVNERPVRLEKTTEGSHGGSDRPRSKSGYRGSNDSGERKPFRSRDKERSGGGGGYRGKSGGGDRPAYKKKTW
ncbi:MAG: DEAD/DEAH box helicase [Bacteroidia bacterium]